MSNNAVRDVLKKWQALSAEDKVIFGHVYSFTADTDVPVPAKRGGRPKGSRNKAKTGVEDAVASGAV
jgi:hypothetical protein